jgi:hypothetical protein
MSVDGRRGYTDTRHLEHLLSQLQCTHLAGTDAAHGGFNNTTSWGSARWKNGFETAEDRYERERREIREWVARQAEIDRLKREALAKENREREHEKEKRKRSEALGKRTRERETEHTQKTKEKKRH